MKKNLIFLLIFSLIQSTISVSIELPPHVTNPHLDTVTNYGIPKDDKGKERAHEKITVISFASDPIYFGVVEKRKDFGEIPKLFGDIYKLDAGKDQPEELKGTIFRPVWGKGLRTTSGNDRLLFFTTDQNNLKNDDTLLKFIKSTDCSQGKGCINVGEGAFSTRDAFIIYPINASGKPDLNGTELRGAEDSITTRSIRKDLMKSIGLPY